jgi:hypothetical protein
VRPLDSIFFKCKYKEIDTLYGVSFDIVVCMVAAKYLIFCYALKIPVLGASLNYGTNKMLKNGTASPPSVLVFNIA